jgi:hypothetical protein
LQFEVLGKWNALLGVLKEYGVGKIVSVAAEITTVKIIPLLYVVDELAKSPLEI